MKGKKLTALTLSLTLAVTSVLGGVTSVVWADETGNTQINELAPVLVKVEEEAIVEDAFADASKDKKLALVIPEETYYQDEDTGFIWSERAFNVLESEPVGDVALAKGTLPEAFQWYGAVKNAYPGTRNQGGYGTCWAFATTACAEFDLVKNHGFSASSTDLSELQIAYFTYHSAIDELKGLSGDGIIGLSGDYLQMGGNSGFATTALSQWKGYTTESTIPYSWAENTIPSKYAQYNNIAKLKTSVQMDIHNNSNAVKSWVYNYGAVSAMYFHHSDYYSLYNNFSTYYNSNSYYSGSINHAVAIVGWDDNFSRLNFPSNNRPSTNGAWLVRNSWATNATSGCEEGYFYMSYEDVTLGDLVYGLDFVSGSEWDHNYQYDGSPSKGYTYAAQAANIFSTSSNGYGKNIDGYNSETIDAVTLSFEYDTSVNYKIQIYTGLTSSSNPTSGYLQSTATTSGWTTGAGVYTIPLKNKVVVSPDEKFSVVVTAMNGNAFFDREITDEQYAWNSNNELEYLYTAKASSSSNQSFSRYSTSSSWQDVGADGSGNMCIKALNSDSNTVKYKIAYNLNGGTNNSGNKPYYLSSDGTITLKTPTRSGYHFLGWYTDSSFKNKISSFSGSTGKNLTLYAKWGEHNFSTEIVKQKATMTKDGLLDMKCTGCSAVESYYILHPTSAKLSYTKTTYSGSRKRPTVTVKTEKGALSSSLYSVSYSNNLYVGRGKVTIKLPEKYYTGSLVRRFSIVPKAPSSSTAKLYGYDDVKFSWSKSTGADGYYVYYKRSTSDSYTLWGKTTKRYAKIKNLKDGKKYNFKVVPYFKSGDTRYKALQSKKSSTYTLKKVSLKSFKKSDGKVSVRWYNINGETGYQISRSTKKSGTNIVVTYKTTKGTYKKVKATKGKTYYYKVRAYKTVKIDGKTKKIYGPWSKAKKYVR